MAGPYAGTREEATERTALLALLQPIETDTLSSSAPHPQPERRDSAAAAGALERLAGKLLAAKGAAELRLLAGAYIARSGETATLSASSARLLSRKHRPPLRRRSSSWRALMIGLQRNTEAITLLEHLILTYPTSALVPQARRARRSTRGDTQDMKRRDFLTAAAGGAGMLLTPRSALEALARMSPAAPWLLVPMDEVQADHLKAYGVAFPALERSRKVEWLLNYRSGSFLLPGDAETVRDCALAGVNTEPADDSQVARVRAEIQQSNMDAVPLEKAPKVACMRRPTRHPGTMPLPWRSTTPA